jgi:hypothetical protein
VLVPSPRRFARQLAAARTTRLLRLVDSARHFAGRFLGRAVGVATIYLL